MAMDFPNSPALYDTFSAGSNTWSYDGQKWVLVPQSINLDDLGDVDLTITPLAGDVLSFNGTDWVSASISGGNAAINISDTAPLGPEEGDLWFDSTSATTYIYYDSFWIDINGTQVSTPNIEDLANVDISIHDEGDLLVYSNVLSEWVNIPIYAANPRTFTTISSSATTTIGTFPKALFKSAEFTIEIEQGQKTTAAKVMVAHNGTNIGLSQFGTVEIGSPAIPITLSVDISGDNARLRVSISDAATTSANVITTKMLMRHLHNE